MKTIMISTAAALLAEATNIKKEAEKNGDVETLRLVLPCDMYNSYNILALTDIIGFISKQIEIERFDFLTSVRAEALAIPTQLPRDKIFISKSAIVRFSEPCLVFYDSLSLVDVKINVKEATDNHNTLMAMISETWDIPMDKLDNWSINKDWLMADKLDELGIRKMGDE